MAKKSNIRHEPKEIDHDLFELMYSSGRIPRQTYEQKKLDQNNTNINNDLTRFEEYMTTSKPLYDANTEKKDSDFVYNGPELKIDEKNYKAYIKARKTAIEKFQKEHFGEKSIIRT